MVTTEKEEVIQQALKAREEFLRSQQGSPSFIALGRKQRQLLEHDRDWADRDSPTRFLDLKIVWADADDLLEVTSEMPMTNRRGNDE